MKAWIVSIGYELLMGQVVNTNAAFLGQKLTTLGFDVQRIITIPDQNDQIKQTLQQAAGRVQLVVATGGLGPTSDDITKPALLDFFGGNLQLNQQALKHVEQFLQMRGQRLTHLQRQQAMVPSTAKVIQNPYGTAPGLWFEHQNTVFVFMPGVPFEMQQMFEQNVEPLLRQYFDLPQVYIQLVHTFGKLEAQLTEALKDFEARLPEQVKLAYLPSPEDIKIKLWAYGRDEAMLRQMVEEQVAKLRKILGNTVWGIGDVTMPQVVQDLFVRHGLTLSTAESCTGGNIAHMITSVPGSSQYYKGSVVAYSNEVKRSVLGVAERDLQKFGAVSQPVVEQMASGVRSLLKTDFSVATSGIAGPTGGSPDKPVGTVWIAVATPERVFSGMFRFGNRRDINIRKSSAMALYQLILRVKEYLGIDQ